MPLACPSKPRAVENKTTIILLWKMWLGERNVWNLRNVARHTKKSERQHPTAAAYRCKSHQCHSTHQGQEEGKDTKQLQTTALGLEAHPLLQCFCRLWLPLSWYFVYVISFCLHTKLTRCPVHMLGTMLADINTYCLSPRPVYLALGPR